MQLSSSITPSSPWTLNARKTSSRAAAKGILPKRIPPPRSPKLPSAYADIWYRLREPRCKLFDLLDGNGGKFIDCLVDHFRTMARSIPEF